jgi:hypothetical protein
MSSDSVRPASKSPVLMAPEMSACSQRNQSSVSSASTQIRIVRVSNTHFQKQITPGLSRLLQKLILTAFGDGKFNFHLPCVQAEVKLRSKGQSSIPHTSYPQKFTQIYIRSLN